MDALGIRFGIGTDGTRSDGFRLIDSAEATQRIAFGLGIGDSSCGGGWTWLDHATGAGADAIGLGAVTGRIAVGLAADCLLVDIDTPEFTPSWDLTWELVRFGNRDQIVAVMVAGRLRLWKGWPVDWDGRALMKRISAAARIRWRGRRSSGCIRHRSNIARISTKVQIAGCQIRWVARISNAVSEYWQHRSR